jgi:hypothetical protein
VGPQVLFGGGGAIDRDADAFDALCDDLNDERALDECGAGSETRLGLTPGLGGGALFRMGRTASMSSELLVQYTNLELFTFEAGGPGSSIRQMYGYEGLRFWLVVGVGLGR